MPSRPNDRRLVPGITRDDFADRALVEESCKLAAGRQIPWGTNRGRHQPPDHEVLSSSEGNRGG